MSNDDTRPTFYINQQPVRAAGLLIWCRYQGEIYVLLTRYNYKEYQNLWADLGGKTEIGDTDPLHTAIRECSEETNCCLVSNKTPESKHHVRSLMHRSNKFLKKQYHTKTTPIYVPQSKYMIYPIELPNSKRTIENFGEIEYHTGYEREIKWWSLTEIKTLQESNHLHFRLRDPRINQSILKSLPSKTPSKIPKETPKNL